MPTINDLIKYLGRRFGSRRYKLYTAMEDAGSERVACRMKQACQRVLKLIRDNPGLCQSRDSYGRTPLHVAVASLTGGRDECLELMLSSGADPNVQDDSGRTPLHISTNRYVNLSDAKILLHGGADPNIQDNSGRTPLHNVSHGHDSNTVKIIEILLRNGADPRLTDKDGMTPLDNFVECYRRFEFQTMKRYEIKIIELLCSHGGGDLSTELERYGQREHERRTIVLTRRANLLSPDLVKSFEKNGEIDWDALDQEVERQEKERERQRKKEDKEKYIRFVTEGATLHVREIIMSYVNEHGEMDRYELDLALHKEGLRNPELLVHLCNKFPIQGRSGAHDWQCTGPAYHERKWGG